MKKLLILIISALFVCALAAGTAPEKVKVGLYVDFGSKGNGVLHLASLIAHSPQTELVTVMAEDIRAGKLVVPYFDIFNNTSYCAGNHGVVLCCCKVCA